MVAVRYVLHFEFLHPWFCVWSRKMTVPMVVGCVLVGWCVISVTGGLVWAAIRREPASAPPVPSEACLMCELERIEKQVRP